MARSSTWPAARRAATTARSLRRSRRRALTTTHLVAATPRPRRATACPPCAVPASRMYTASLALRTQTACERRHSADPSARRTLSAWFGTLKGGGRRHHRSRRRPPTPADIQSVTSTRASAAATRAGCARMARCSTWPAAQRRDRCSAMHVPSPFPSRRQDRARPACTNATSFL